MHFDSCKSFSSEIMFLGVFFVFLTSCALTAAAFMFDVVSRRDLACPPAGVFPLKHFCIPGSALPSAF